MPIAGGLSEEEIKRLCEEKTQRLIQNLMYRLQVIGEQVRTQIITHKTYKDNTGHLKNSTGYMIALNGEVKFSSFGEGDGAKAGQIYAKQILSNHNEGVCLIIVAGKNYAQYVANRGYDVIDSGVLLAEQLINKLTQK